MSEVQRRRKIYDFLLEFIRKIGKEEQLHKYQKDDYFWTGTARDVAIWPYLDNFNCKFKYYDQFFDKAICWDRTEEGFEYWVSTQLRFYYCLWYSGLSRSVAILRDFYMRVKGHYPRYSEADLLRNNKLLRLVKLELDKIEKL